MSVAHRRAPAHRVLLVREWDQQVGGSGCCGRLSSAVTETIGGSCPSPYAHARGDMERMGAVYRALRERLDDVGRDDVELAVVDPRNTAWLLPAVWSDARRRGLSVWESLREVNRATAACTLVCDGLVLAHAPSPQRAVAAVQRDLGLGAYA